MRISLVIPCKNEASYIARCLQSVVDADSIGLALQVWVCDGNSTDGTQAIVRSFAAKYHYIQLLINEKETTPYALNLGLKAGSFDIGIILGAHAEIDRAFFQENVKTLLSNQAIGCAGGIIENIHENEQARIISLAMSSPFGVGNAHFRTAARSGYVDTVAFGAYKKEVFEQCGYFDEALTRNQDDEFNFRVTKAGFKIYLNPAIRSKYYVRGSYKKLWRQYFQYGYWKVFVNRKHQTLTTLRQLAPAMMVALAAVLALLCMAFPNFLFIFLACGLLYGSAGIYFASKKTSQPGELWQMLKVYMLLHLSYGLGYWRGIFHFLVLNKQPETKQTTLSR